ncbi:hypothetical protein GCM10022214_13480 [Actinomadura miaoliensis]|uniref:Uncharacterized protein n=1 Tax=Actinomadura miaoliensis TaxID=430685 RepID=A0ABP7V8U3_9ACTN
MHLMPGRAQPVGRLVDRGPQPVHRVQEQNPRHAQSLRSAAPTTGAPVNSPPPTPPHTVCPPHDHASGRHSAAGAGRRDKAHHHMPKLRVTSGAAPGDKIDQQAITAEPAETERAEDPYTPHPVQATTQLP